MNFRKKDDLNRFINELPFLGLANINSAFYEMLPLCDVGTSIAFSKFLLLQRRVYYASYSLINAYKKDHNNILGDPFNDTLSIRSMYFEYAIETYNKVVDYVYQILYFNYKLYKVIDNIDIKSKRNIISVSRKLKGKKLKEVNRWILIEEKTKDFAKKFSDYRCKMRDVNDLANDIKHRGCIDVGGMNPTRYSKVIKNVDGVAINITDLVSEIKVDLESEIDKLVETHKATFQLQNELYLLCNFQQQLEDFFDENV